MPLHAWMPPAHRLSPQLLPQRLLRPPLLLPPPLSHRPSSPPPLIYLTASPLTAPLRSQDGDVFKHAALATKQMANALRVDRGLELGMGAGKVLTSGGAAGLEELSRLGGLGGKAISQKATRAVSRARLSREGSAGSLNSSSTGGNRPSGGRNSRGSKRVYPEDPASAPSPAAASPELAPELTAIEEISQLHGEGAHGEGARGEVAQAVLDAQGDGGGGLLDDVERGCSSAGGSSSRPEPEGGGDDGAGGVGAVSLSEATPTQLSEPTPPSSSKLPPGVKPQLGKRRRTAKLPAFWTTKQSEGIRLDMLAKACSVVVWGWDEEQKREVEGILGQVTAVSDAVAETLVAVADQVADTANELMGTSGSSSSHAPSKRVEVPMEAIRLLAMSAGQVPVAITQARDVHALTDASNELSKATAKLDEANGRVKHGTRKTAGQLQQQQAEAQKLSERVAALEDKVGTLRAGARHLPIAFVTFKTTSGAKAALKCSEELLRTTGVKVGPAPRPTDIVWNHLHRKTDGSGGTSWKTAYTLLVLLIMAPIIASTILVATAFSQMCLFWVPANL